MSEKNNSAIDLAVDNLVSSIMIRIHDENFTLEQREAVLILLSEEIQRSVFPDVPISDSSLEEKQV